MEAALALCLLLAPRGVCAQESSPFRGRANVLVGYVPSRDQQVLYGLDLPAVSADLRAGYAVHEVVTIEGRLGGTAFLSSRNDPGALLDLSVGAEVATDFDVGRAYLAVHFGAGLTGTLVRPVLHIGAGLDFRASPEFWLGPIFQYSHVFQEDGSSSAVVHSDDAIFLSLGLSMRFAPANAVPSPERVDEATARESAPPSRVPPRRPPHPLIRVTLSTPPIEEAALMEMIDEAVRPEPRELLVPVLFAFDSTEIVSCSVASLHALREYLEAHPEIALLEVEGHADGSGTEEYNRELSIRRAETLRDWLIVHGVAPERLVTAARGETSPVEENDAEDGRTQNRRARFRVLEDESR